MKIKIICLLACAAFTVSCRQEKQKLAEKIAAHEKQLAGDTTGLINYNKANAMVKLYEEYAEKYPGDEVSAVYLYKAADVSAQTQNTRHAIDLYARINEKYPNHKYAPQALFLKGFLYENQLKNIDQARNAYTKLLTEYPRFEQAQTVKWLLQNLGKSDREIVRQFEAINNYEDTVPVTIHDKGQHNRAVGK